MNYKLVLKTYAQLRQLTDPETALLSTLRGMSESERELLAETLGPPVKKKPVATTRNIEHCVGTITGNNSSEPCGLTKRAAIHKDASVAGYHEFVSGKPKSARASSIAGRVAGVAGNSKPPTLCDYELDGKVCHGEEGDSIHDKSLGYLNYHPFVSSATARNAVGQSSTNGSEVSSEAATANASIAMEG